MWEKKILLLFIEGTFPQPVTPFTAVDVDGTWIRQIYRDAQ